MFEDIVNAKFEGVDIGDREIVSEIRASIMKAVKFVEDEEFETIDDEAKKIISEFFDRNLDEMTEMYLNYFETDELIEMLDFEMTEAAKKKSRFQFKLQTFMSTKMIELLSQYDEEELEARKDEDKKHRSLVDDWEDDQMFIWDSKEEKE
jgi:hypothetical protein